MEHTIYQKFEAYTPGSVSNVRVVGRRYEANLINVEYSWLFTLDDDVFEGGMIDLIFPKNFYNVQNSIPIPTFEVFLGLEPVNGVFS